MQPLPETQVPTGVAVNVEAVWTFESACIAAEPFSNNITNPSGVVRTFARQGDYNLIFVLHEE